MSILVILIILFVNLFQLIFQVLRAVTAWSRHGNIDEFLPVMEAIFFFRGLESTSNTYSRKVVTVLLLVIFNNFVSFSFELH